MTSKPTQIHPLTFSTTDFLKSVKSIGDALKKFVDGSRAGNGNVVRFESVTSWRQELQLEQFVERAGSAGDPALVAEFVEQYLDSLIRLNDPRFIGHQIARPHFASALADLVNGMTNNGMAVYEMGPGPVTLEKFVVDWLLQFFPNPAWSDGGGFLTHGGSLANLTALLAARGIQDPDSWKSGVNRDLCFMIPEASHYCVKRAICILGYGEDSIVYLPTNRFGQIEVGQIDESYQAALDRGKKPIAITANAASTPTGLFDDLSAIGKFATAKGMWFHVDGAHGASALVSERYRSYLAGIEYADSIVWDQHKLLQTSALCTSVLFRRASSLNTIFQQQASYLNESLDEERPNLFRHTIECTKVPMSLKFYLCLLACGPDGLARFLESLFEQTHKIYELISAREGFRCPCPPQSNILCFQYRPDEWDQFALRHHVVSGEQFYFTQTELAGEKYMRFTVTNPETDVETVNRLMDEVEKVASEMR